MRLRSGLLPALAFALAFTSIACADRGGTDLGLVDLLGHAVDPFAEGHAAVFLFVRTDCPISNRYAPTVARLADRFEGKGVSFWLVYADDAESGDEIRRHLDDFELAATTIRPLRDPGRALYGAVTPDVTPEAALFDATRRLRYRGRIDDRFVSFSEARPAPTREDLRLAIEAVLEGREVEVSETRAIGCAIEERA